MPLKPAPAKLQTYRKRIQIGKKPEEEQEMEELLKMFYSQRTRPPPSPPRISRWLDSVVKKMESSSLDSGFTSSFRMMTGRSRETLRFSTHIELLLIAVSIKFNYRSGHLEKQLKSTFSREMTLEQNVHLKIPRMCNKADSSGTISTGTFLLGSCGLTQLKSLCSNFRFVVVCARAATGVVRSLWWILCSLAPLS
ncbi:unnamed protein product [Pleuronectes platessa]|uniref:Uncharacterized protein n=1 Tax=Pleuronectes platessa TaxID=8262 RepID=A0A9N7YL98_PLEPL|nr:unnamed protein product [Pleuronectes platessa]